VVRPAWRRVKAWWQSAETIPARWLRAAHQALLGEMPILAAGTALFAIVATVPALAAAVSIYGLASDPNAIQSHLSGLERVLPNDVVKFLGDQLARQAARSTETLTLQLATTILMAVLSARASARALVDALNRAYRVRERRRPMLKLAVTLAIAGCTLVGLMMLFGVIVALPGLMATWHMETTALARWGRWPLLLGVVFGALVALYRYGPSPRPLGTVRHTWPGAGVSTVLLMLVSLGLSEWVDRVADYEVFYGAFGSVIVIVLWFYLSTIALVIGGFVNAELERHAGAPDPDRSMY
jgi:membrane protein